MIDLFKKEIFKIDFNYPIATTVPMQSLGLEDDSAPDVIYTKEPSVTLVVPYHKDIEYIDIYNPYSSAPAFRKKINEIDIKFKTIKKSFFKSPNPTPAEIGKLHILIMASGFKSGEMDVFTSKSVGIKNYLLSKEPFSSYASYISIHIFENLENLDCSPGCYGIDRLLCCSDNKVISAAASSGYLYDEIIVIHNTDTYSGAGSREYLDGYKSNSYNTYCVVYKGTDINGMVLHELGHSFGNLCDEYSYSTEGYQYNLCVNCRDNCNVWSSISSYCQTGCDAKSNYYRPEDSIMIDYSSPFFNSPSLYSEYLPDGLFKRLDFFIQQDNNLLTLDINESTGGTTDPSPGTYSYDRNMKVSIQAIPDDHYVFGNWSGDASGTDNPIVLNMLANKSITANFRAINPPSDFNGSKSTNRNIFQIEYVDILKWKANPNNQGINISKYRIFLIDGNTETQIAEVDKNTFTYMRRQAGKDAQKYSIVCMLNDGRIGFVSFVTVQ